MASLNKGQAATTAPWPGWEKEEEDDRETDDEESVTIPGPAGRPRSPRRTRRCTGWGGDAGARWRRW